MTSKSATSKTVAAKSAASKMQVSKASVLRGVQEALRRYGLACACIAGPLLMYCVMQATSIALVPGQGIADIKLEYIVRDEVSVKASQAQPSPSPAATNNATVQAAASKTETSANKKAEPDAKIQPWAHHIAGRYNVVATTGFISLIAFFAILFGGSIIYRWAGGRVLVGMIVFACIFAALAAFALYSGKFARALILDGVLNAADAHAQLKILKAAESTADIVNRLILWTNFIGYAGSGLVLGALAVLSVRAPESGLTIGDLKRRRDLIRIGLGLASAILAVAVISTKILLQWPLSLLIDSQAAALKVIADAIVLRWGTLGTITLVAAFVPALVSWWLDVETFRSKAVPAVSGPANDGLDFAILPALGGFVAILAPIVASPFVDVLTAILGAVK